MKFINYEIDETKLKRNYIVYPIKITPNGVNSEKLDRLELLYLYIELNMMVSEIAKFVGVGISNVERWLKKENIKKDAKLIAKNNEKSCMKKYGTKNAGWIKETREKIIKTNMKRYGVMFSGGTPHSLEKAKQTNVERYGVEYPQKLITIKEKVKKTNLERYGVENVNQLSEKKEKAKQTNVERYGVEYACQNKLVKEKIKKTNIKKYNRISHTQVHYLNDSYDILISKDKLKNFILENNYRTYINLSHMLNITSTTLRKYVIRYNLESLIDIDTNISIVEKDIRDYINQHFETENNTRKYLDGKEIDIYIPKKNIGIEFNGNFWHNEFGKDKKYHQDKSLLAESKGIFLYHIFEYEWMNNKYQIINQLNNLFGINENKIYARKCIIKEVNNNDKTFFLKENHMQGDDVSSIKLGLYYNDELVSLMTFCKPRFNKKYQYELSRFCGKSNCNVVGGASKLFKYFIDNYNPKSIISYSNIAHTRGNLYSRLGMTLQGISEPNYVWCNNNSILTRYQCQKHKLIKQGYKGISEVDIMNNRGYYRIYDCGNKVWVWEKEKL